MFASYTEFLFVYYKVGRLVYTPVWHCIGVCFKPFFFYHPTMLSVSRCDWTVKMDPSSVQEVIYDVSFEWFDSQQWGGGQSLNEL